MPDDNEASLLSGQVEANGGFVLFASASEVLMPPVEIVVSKEVFASSGDTGNDSGEVEKLIVLSCEIKKNVGIESFPLYG